MSRIRTNLITNRMANGAPTVSNGLVISGVTTVTTLDLNGDLDVDGHLNADNVSIAGIVTATSFVGSGANLTSLPAANLTGTLPAISGANLTSLPAQATIANNADNRIITGGSGVNLNGEANLTFNGSKLVNAGSQTLTAGTAPQYRLHASSGDGTDNDRAIFGLATANNHFINGTSAGDTILRTTNSGNLLFGVGTSEKLRIDSSGRVLIGNYTDDIGDGKLQVYTSDRKHPAIRTNSSNANGYAMFSDAYQADESQVNIGISYSSAKLVLSTSVKVSDTADNTYLSSQDTFAARPCALTMNHQGVLSFLNTNTNATTTTDSAVSLTERMRIHKEGYVTKPNQPSFNVTIGGGQINSNVGVIVFTDTTSLANHNTGNHYNTSNGRFTAPVAGRYQINARMLTNSSTQAYTIYLLRVNANHHGYIGHNHSDFWFMESGSWVLDLNANDYVDCFLQVHSGHGGFNYASFSGFLVG